MRCQLTEERIRSDRSYSPLPSAPKKGLGGNERYSILASVNSRASEFSYDNITYLGTK